LTFHIFEEIRFEELKETPEQQPSQSTGESSASKKDTPEKAQRKKSQPKPVPKKPKEREQDIFRRIHYVHELIKRRGTVLRSSGCQKTDSNDGKYLDDLPPLHQAAAIGDLETVERLLKERPGDIESEGGCDSAKPLHYAAYQGRQDVAIFLIEHGARLDTRDCDEATPLHWSVPFGQLSMFRLLIESGADINVCTNKRRTPLHWCGWKNQPAIARYILEEGFDVHVLDSDDRPPIAYCEGDCSELIRLLVDEGADVNFSSVEQLTPLHVTAEYCSVDAVRTLLEYGPDVNAVDNKSFTPLSLAMRREESSEEICELLISHGASVSGIDHGVPEPIHEAVGRPSILRLLLSHGADTEARHKNGRTSLHNSIDIGEATTMAYLLDSGANIDATDNEGNTVLHFAMAQPNPDFARDLIEAGAEVNENNKSQNPLHWITLNSSGDTLRLLAGHGVRYPCI
jgi:ankyrin repeat protein